MIEMVPKEELLEQRLDGLDEKVDKGFAGVDDRFKQVDTKMDEGFARVDADIRELRSEMRGVRDSINDMQLQLVGGAVVVIAAVVGSAIAF
jgi:hypothetical protein